MPKLIQYVGTKPAGKTDNVAGTGLRWDAPGEIHEVADEAAAKLLKHPDVWREVIAEASALEPVKQEADTPPGLRWLLELDNGERLVLDAMDDEFVKGFADANGLKVDKRKKGDALRAAVHEAALAAQAEAAQATVEQAKE